MDKKEKARLLTKLKQFKTFFERRVSLRGKELYKEGSVLEAIYNARDNSIDAEVVSSMQHKTYQLRLYLPNLLLSNCECPYDWGFCKHIAATTFYLIDNLNTKPNQTLSITQQETIVSVDKLNKRWLDKMTPDALQEEVSILEQNADFEIENPSSGELVVIIHVGGNQIPVTFIARKGSLNVTTKCNCREDRFVLCKHKLASLSVLKKKWKTNAFDKCLDWTDEENELAEDYGVTPDMVRAKSTPLYYFFENRILRIAAASNKLMHGSLLDLIPESGLKEESTPPGGDAEANFALVYVLRMWQRSNGIPSIEVSPFSGKLNKSGTKIKSHFKQLFDPVTEPVFVNNATETDYQILQKSALIHEVLNPIHALADDEMPSYELLRPAYGLLKTLFELLSERRVYVSIDQEFYYYGPEIKLKDCEPVEVASSPVKASLTQKINDQLGTLLIRYHVDGKIIEPEPKNQSHYWFIKQNSTLYPWDNPAVLFLYEISGYENLDRIEFLEVQRNKVYEKFIRFFQDKMEVKMEQPEIEVVNATEIEKRVYLKEKEGYILFYPVMIYGEMEVSTMRRSGVTIYNRQGDQISEIRRDTEAEEQMYSTVLQTSTHFLHQKQTDSFYLTVEQMLENNWFITFYEQCRESDISVYGFKDLKSIKYHPAGASVSYSIKSEEDWFDIDLAVSFDDHKVSLKDLRKAVVNRENLVPIGDGVYGMLPDDFLKKFSSALKVGEIEADTVKLQKSQFTVIHALLDKQSDARIIEELAEKVQMLKSFDKIETVNPPQKLKATMRDYQKAGLSWLAFLAKFNFGGCLADDMGLGKTLQMLAFFLHLKEKDKRKKHIHLVVCPTTLIFNWKNEIKKFAPDLKTLVHWGTQRKFDERDLKKHDVVLTSYGTMVNDIEKLHEFPFHTVVFDESQAMKNPSSLRFKAALVLKAENRFSLTGTPIENNTIELYAQMHVLNRGLLGPFSTFRKTYGSNLEGEENKHLRQELRKIIYPFIIRRTKEKVAAELPEKSEIELYCEMGEHQRRVYDAFREKYKDKLLNQIDKEGLNKARFNVLDGILKLRQICDSPALVNTEEYYGDDSAKADELIRYILEKTKKHKVLVFSQFVKMLELIRKRLDEHDVVYTSLDGRTRDREERVNYFQNNEDCRVFLISLKAGGYGLNLTAADYVFLVDPWWNPAVESQAIDRTHRIGQEKKVFAYRMICQNTIEEKILNLQKRKKSLADEIITEESSFVKKLTAKDIEHLFS